MMIYVVEVRHLSDQTDHHRWVLLEAHCSMGTAAARRNILSEDTSDHLHAYRIRPVHISGSCNPSI